MPACPKCGAPRTRILNLYRFTTAVVTRRVCDACHHQFLTRRTFTHLKLV